MKALDFVDFCKVAELMKTKAHLTEHGLEEIRKIKVFLSFYYRSPRPPEGPKDPGRAGEYGPGPDFPPTTWWRGPGVFLNRKPSPPSRLRCAGGGNPLSPTMRESGRGPFLIYIWNLLYIRSPFGPASIYKSTDIIK